MVDDDVWSAQKCSAIRVLDAYINNLEKWVQIPCNRNTADNLRLCVKCDQLLCHQQAPNPGRKKHSFPP